VGSSGIRPDSAFNAQARTLGIVGIRGWGAAGPIAFLLLAKVFGRAKTGDRVPE
jgi:hypothetical protein